MGWNKLNTETKLRVLQEAYLTTGYPLFIIEKDWWVVQTLRLVTQMDITEHIVFKSLCTATHKPFYV
ncbi:hypothetical protein AGMMS50239_40730 [Bacteroidia bacterium]|nr:hypothetical protein AGMMS50239_40730 [Bacteroidia bacterium]